MAGNALRLVAVLLTAVTTAAGWAHLLALPNKIGLPRDAYLTVRRSTADGPSWASWSWGPCCPRSP